MQEEALPSPPPSIASVFKESNLVKKTEYKCYNITSIPRTGKE
jgi:hypothetical protein